MNRENLQRAADHLRTIPQEMFDMRTFRDGDQESAECNSVGCAVGHCTVLDESRDFPRNHGGTILFYSWSKKFFEVTHWEWEWLFAPDWKCTDNTPEGAALRIEWLLKNGLPKDSEEQVRGYGPLCYKGGES